MNDYETILIYAVMYAITKSGTGVQKQTVNYIYKEIEENKLSETCLFVMEIEIEKEIENSKMHIYYKDIWLELLDKLKIYRNLKES